MWLYPYFKKRNRLIHKEAGHFYEIHGEGDKFYRVWDKEEQLEYKISKVLVEVVYELSQVHPSWSRSSRLRPPYLL